MTGIDLPIDQLTKTRLHKPDRFQKKEYATHASWKQNLYCDW